MELARRQSMLERMRGAALLDIPTYEEVEHDTTATGQAALVVGIVAIATAIAQVRAGAPGVVAGLVTAYLGWAVWSGVTYLIGTWLGGTATWGEMLRTIGFAQTPGVLRVFGVIPVLGTLVQLVVFVWMLIAGVIAIRQALDFGTGKAIVTAVIGLVLYIIVAAVLLAVTGVPIRG
ncbi:MAG TPA: Yip1 family protein [Longimicrobiales bacterium]